MTASDTLSGQTSVETQSGSAAAAAVAIVIAALTFNQVLAFVNASITPVTPLSVMAAEVLILAAAASLVWNRSESLYPLSVALAAWLVFAMTMRSGFDPKVLRDAFIPVLFYFLGQRCGTPETCDRLVAISIAIVGAFAVIEWAFLDTYIRYVDILGYYLAKGSTDVTLGGDGPGLFTSGIRFEGRTLLPFLGEHRVSSVFLEPVSLGNFGAIAFAWLLLRFRAYGYAFYGWTALVLIILVLGDARFGIYLCATAAAIYLVAPLVRPGLVFVVPFVLVVVLLAYAGALSGGAWDNTLLGRFLLSGQLLSTLDGWQALGLAPSDVNFVDSGYATVLSQFGLFGAAGLWAVYLFGSPAETPAAWRFKLFVCFYLILLLSISTSFATIKTAALLWFLAGGTAENPPVEPGERCGSAGAP
ncbi:MAG: surface polysaccharide polymerase [Rhodoplanes sp.]|uniref:surface polysaccharide polymerase n=1 Tax=Rhodoplanes sp. TaxID=1968906 RepID=UPI0017EA8BE1|nr:surface polysaccharide polymerase [Rhodoplanes sp.]NVO15337.1 surface polysaccharide polymerase [Rhodoplanes sp.]